MAAIGSDPQAMQHLWRQTIERVKKDVIAPTLWRALESTVAVAWENNTFAVGLAAGDGQLASSLNSGEHQSAIEQALRAVSGKSDLKFRMIEGTTRSDWEHVKAQDAAVTAQRQQTAQKKYAQAESFASWDEIYDQVSRLWASSEYRALASGKARFLTQALAMAEKAMAELLPEDGKTNEQTERGLSRVIERIASMTGSDATLLAYILFERRKGGRQA